MRSTPGLIGACFLAVLILLCIATLPWTMGRPATVAGEPGQPRYNQGRPAEGRLPPAWWPANPDQQARLNAMVPPHAADPIVAASGRSLADVTANPTPAEQRDLKKHWPSYRLGTDNLGRSLLLRCLVGGGISLGVGIAAALVSVLIGTIYGAMSGYAGGRIDALMMRIVDILYALPYVLLVVLIAVAADATIDRAVASRVPLAAQRREAYVTQALARLPADRQTDQAVIDELRQDAVERFGTGELRENTRTAINVVTLLIAIGGVSWLTLARVIRGQVLSLKHQPFVEAARAIGVSRRRIFIRHLLPNLVGPIVVYTTLTVPQAILQESFLSFLGIGVKPPLPSWGNLAAEGLGELNPHQSNWWLLLFPCLLLGLTLLALNFVGEALRETMDPKRARR